MIKTDSGIYYAVLKFILEYCSPLNWPSGLWQDFQKATDSKKGRYSIWRNYQSLTVNIRDLKFQNLPITPEMEPDLSPPEIPIIMPPVNIGDIQRFAEFVVTKIEEIQCLEGKGWLALLQSYRWPKGKGNFESGIDVRRHFHFLVNDAAEATGRGALTYQHGLCNAIAGWAGIPQKVSKTDASNIFSTIRYLKNTLKMDLIDINQIYGRRISTTSKVYYFSDPLYWTIYDSRVAYSLSQLAHAFEKADPDAASRLGSYIIFPVPPNQSGRVNPKIQWNDNLAASSFIRASFILRAIADSLNKRKKTPPSKAILSSGIWELSHVEMVLFVLGKNFSGMSHQN